MIEPMVYFESHRSAKLQSWRPTYSNKRQVDAFLCQWEKLAAQKLFLVYWLDLHQFERSELSRKGAEEVFREWEVFSTRLFYSGSHYRKRKKSQAVREKWLGATTDEVGLVLEVPPQNIIGSFSGEVAFPLGTPDSAQRFSDALAGYFSVPRFRRIKGGKRLSPWELVNKKDDKGVLVIGQPGWKMGLKQTQEIRVKNIIYAPDYDAAMDLGRMGFVRWSLLGRLRALNPGLEVLAV